ncbi:MAG: hypothetical protein ACR2PJ_04805, partial [Pseudomonadales bacterium]
PLDAVRDEISDTLKRSQATQMAQAQAASMVSAIEGGSLAQFVADQHDLSWQVHNSATRYLTNPDPDWLTDSAWASIIGGAFSLPRPVEGKESLNHLALDNGNSFVLRVSSADTSIPQDMDAEERAAIQQAIASQMGDADVQEFRSALRQAASVERN